MFPISLESLILSKAVIVTPHVMTSITCRYSIISTGGTASSLENAGVSVTKVEQLTCFPEMVSWFLSCSCHFVIVQLESYIHFSFFSSLYLSTCIMPGFACNNLPRQVHLSSS